MFRLLFVLSLALMTFSQCKTTKKPENENPTEEVTPKPTETTTTKEQTAPEEKEYIQGGGNQPSNNVLEFFSTDYWLPQFAISGLSKEAHLPYQGMWLDFDSKGQFVGGINNKNNIVGSWKFDTQKNMLFILSNNKDIEGKWKVNRSGFAMVWLAREGQKLQDIQIKLVNSSSRPNQE